MQNIEARNLGDAGLVYVREHLAEVNVLCSALLRTIISVPGEVFTLAPHGTSEERLGQFTQGGLLPQNLKGAGAVTLPDGSTIVPVISLIEQQARLLREAIAATPGAVCIVDDFNPKWSDRHKVSYLGPTAFGVGEEVYHLLTADHNEKELVAILNDADTIWHGVAAVCQSSPALDRSRETSEAELRQCASTVVLLTCVAYDGEGFVAWCRMPILDP